MKRKDTYFVILTLKTLPNPGLFTLVIIIIFILKALDVSFYKSLVGEYSISFKYIIQIALQPVFHLVALFVFHLVALFVALLKRVRTLD